ncbi:MAG: septal ring lytic transglycosylase RlpA family protein [Gammaproteobacteria bacterium]|nr:septal ring lytic transglycosylase RlpA family protein [Sideroxydans sp.]MBU3903473.1 septal ring lytic transglycosylase RlpA family protein [Gammaproteobacteria bacterium]MBU4045514.1 septal ring lytic transglycosylase RlpA family protein [Gammaproteobacteria bacterium]
MNRNLIIILAGIALLSACSNIPRRTTGETAASKPAAAPATTDGKYLAGDGPGADVPDNLDSIPDAIPKAEPLHRYANRPYSALGKTYTPLQTVGSYKERGTASWYGKKFHGQRTSIGDTYDMYGMTAAHPTLPVPSYARVTNLANGKTVVVRVNDRGPFLHDRIIDLSYAAAYKLGYVNNGSAEVEVESIAVNGNAPVAAAVTAPVVKAESVAAETVMPVMPPDVAGKVYLQLGAFKEKQGAESFLSKMRAELGDTGKDIILLRQSGLNRIQLGPYANSEEARRAANTLAGRLGFKPFVSQH